MKDNTKEAREFLREIVFRDSGIEKLMPSEAEIEEGINDNTDNAEESMAWIAAIEWFKSKLNDNG